MIVFKAPKDKALAALQSVCGIVERRQTLPILANVLLEKSGHALQMTTSDQEIQIRATTDLGGDAQDLRATVGAHKLMDILKTMPGDQVVSLEMQPEKMLLKGGKSRFVLQTLSADDFPLVKEAETFAEPFNVPQKTLKELLAQVSFAMAVQDIRYYLNGILFVAEGQSLTLVATDGHRLAYAQAALDAPVPRQQSVILPRKTVLELQRLLSDVAGDDTPPIGMQFASNQARFRFGSMEFVSKLIEGKFPDYQRVIPQEGSHQNRVTLGRAPLLASLQRASAIIANDEKVKGVHLTLDNGTLRVVASNGKTQEEATDEMDIDYGGAPIDISFNVAYLADALSHMAQEMVTLALQDGNSAMLLTIPGNAHFKYVVMPMRL